MALREHDIRPDHLKEAQTERFLADIRRLLSRKHEFVDVACPACDGRRRTLAFTKFELTYVRCDACETVYVAPRPSPAVLDFYYAASENYQYWNTHIFPASEQARREKIFKPRAARVVEMCARHNAGSGTLLEVGAGFGTFCEEILRLERFERVIAVEPTPALADTCRRKGLEVIEQPIERVRLESSTVDAIVSFEVIEHLFSPRDFLDACGAVLPEGGLLILTCPNVKGFDLSVLGPRSDTFDVEHLNYFHPESLAALLARCGFEVVELSTPGELDAELVRKKILAGECDVTGQPFLQRVLIDEWDRLGSPFQRFVAEHLLSSHMWLAARKAAS